MSKLFLDLHVLGVHALPTEKADKGVISRVVSLSELMYESEYGSG